MNRTDIARIAHEINRAYCAALGDSSQPSWEAAPDWQKASALADVDMHLANPDATPENSHESWLAQKEAEGWKFGPTKDAEKKEHPCFLPYAELPTEQKAKDHLFRAAVHLMKSVEPEKSLVSAPVPLSPPPIAAGHLAVQYIGRQPDWNDHLYGTGLYFVTDMVRHLPEPTARQLLKHIDLFKEAADETEPAPAPEVPRDDTAELMKAAKQKQAEERDEVAKIQDLKQSVSFMDKDALRTFVQTNYRQKVDGRLSVEAMRTQAIQMIDQFGMV